MKAPRAEVTMLENLQVPVQAKLAAAWTSFMLLYAYVDILGLYMPEVIEDILAGIVWEFEISQGWAVGALALMAVPILMVVMSMTLPARANRTTNLVVATAYVLVSVGNAVGESWTYFFGLAVGLEVFVLALVLRLAWTLPRAAAPVAKGHEVIGEPPPAARGPVVGSSMPRRTDRPGGSPPDRG